MRQAARSASYITIDFPPGTPHAPSVHTAVPTHEKPKGTRHSVVSSILTYIFRGRVDMPGMPRRQNVKEKGEGNQFVGPDCWPPAPPETRVRARQV